MSTPIEGGRKGVKDAEDVNSHYKIEITHDFDRTVLDGVYIVDGRAIATRSKVLHLEDQWERG